MDEGLRKHHEQRIHYCDTHIKRLNELIKKMECELSYLKKQRKISYQEIRKNE